MKNRNQIIKERKEKGTVNPVGIQNLRVPSIAQTFLTKVYYLPQAICLRKCSSRFRELEMQHKRFNQAPEHFFKDGEVIFSKKDSYYLKILTSIKPNYTVYKGRPGR